MVKKILAGALFSFLAIGPATQDVAQAQAEKRQQLMKSQSADVKAIKGAVEAKDYATVEAKAKDLMGTSDSIVGAFPAGSGTGKTKAKPEIWEKSADFASHAKNLKKAATELAAAAKAKNDPDIAVKMKAVGDTCGACHKAFRAEKYAE
jgi:cytochrome c556